MRSAAVALGVVALGTVSACPSPRPIELRSDSGSLVLDAGPPGLDAGPVCEGSPVPCAGRSDAECRHDCARDGCFGSPDPCGRFIDRDACLAVACEWWTDHCEGSPWICTHWRQRDDCVPAGCDWDDLAPCAGEPRACEALSPAECAGAPGCAPRMTSMDAGPSGRDADADPASWVDVPGEMDASASVDAPRMDARTLVDVGADARLDAGPPVDAPILPGFSVSAFGQTGCQVVAHESVTGDDHGGIAVTPSLLLVTGDTATARFDASDLSAPASTGVVLESLFSDLATEQPYVMLTAGGAIVDGVGPQDVTQLGVVDRDTGLVTAARVTLSSPVTVRYGVAVMSGWGEALLGVRDASSALLVWSRIDLPSGVVTPMGTTVIPTHAACESFAWWGLAERLAGARHATYVESTTRIVRLAIPETGMGLASPIVVATFTNLGDMCSIAASPSRSRWYFHHENRSQFTTEVDENAGWCPLTFTRP